LTVGHVRRVMTVYTVKVCFATSCIVDVHAEYGGQDCEHNQYT